jgi:ribosomal protein L27
VRQRGSKYYIGTGVARADDDTIYAKKDGSVSFSNKKVRRFSGRLDKKVIVNVA